MTQYFVFEYTYIGTGIRNIGIGLVFVSFFFYIHNLSIHICLLIEKDKKDKSTIWYEGMEA